MSGAATKPIHHPPPTWRQRIAVALAAVFGPRPAARIDFTHCG
jgi:hypothetical protein